MTNEKKCMMGYCPARATNENVVVLVSGRGEVKIDLCELHKDRMKYKPILSEQKQEEETKYFF